MKYLVAILVFIFAMHVTNLVHKEWLHTWCAETPNAECTFSD